MKEARAYIQPFALSSPVQNLDDLPGFPLTANENQGLNRENVNPGDGRTTVIVGLKDLKFLRSRHAT